MAAAAERMDTAEDRLDRIERLAELHGAFATRFEEKVDRLSVAPVFSSLYLPGNLVIMLVRNGVHALAMSDDDETMQLLDPDEVRGRRALAGPARYPTREPEPADASPANGPARGGARRSMSDTLLRFRGGPVRPPALRPLRAHRLRTPLRRGARPTEPSLPMIAP